MWDGVPKKEVIRMKKSLVMVLFIILTHVAFAQAPYQETIRLPEVKNPISLISDAENIYITERAKVFIYSRVDYKLKTSFGKVGSGPGEFTVNSNQPIQLMLRGDEIIIKCLDRLLYFSKAGVFKSETKTVPGFIMALKPMGQQFVGIGQLQKNDRVFLTINIYDDKLDPVNELIQRDEEIHKSGEELQYHFLHFPTRLDYSFAVHNERIYLAWGNDGKIKTFGKDGSPGASIDVPDEKVQINSKLRKQIKKFFKKDPEINADTFKAYYKNMVFPENYPAIRSIRVCNDKIYAVTYFEAKEGTRCYVFKADGSAEGNVNIPLKSANLKRHFPYYKQGEDFYQLFENKEKAFWELHLTEIK